MSKKLDPWWNLNRVLKVFAFGYFSIMSVVFVYLWFVTEDRYISESMFKVTTEAGNSDMTAVVPGAAAGLSGAQTTNGFVASADLLLQLENEFQLSEHYSSPPHDFVFRLRKGASIEERIQFYRLRIKSHYDIIEGVTVISVDTFDRDLSLRINQRLLELTEEFINGINKEIAEEQLSYYVKELERADSNVRDLNQKIVAMQDRYHFISPESVVSTSQRVIDDMYAKKLTVEGEISSLLRDSPGSPRIDILNSQLRSLNESLDGEKAKLSGEDQQRMNLVLMEHQELTQKLEFATELRNVAETTLEKNRMMASHHSRFFILFQKPFKPEKQSLPRRPYATITIFVLGSLVFLILRALTFTLFERA